MFVGRIEGTFRCNLSAARSFPGCPCTSSVQIHVSGVDPTHPRGSSISGARVVFSGTGTALQLIQFCGANVLSAAVDVDDSTGDIAGGCRGEEDRQALKLMHLT